MGQTDEIYQIDMESLLAEVSPDEPCGKDREYEADFCEVLRAVEVKPEQQFGDTIVAAKEIDWLAVRDKVIDVFSRTKDLRMAIALTRSLLHTAGLAGLRDGLLIIKGLLEKYWDTVHPQLDLDDNNDPVMRVNTLNSLNDSASMLNCIRDAVLVKPALSGPLRFRDILMSRGKLPPPASKKAAPDWKPLAADTIEKMFKDARVNDLKAIASAIHQSIETSTAIDSLMLEKIDTANVVNISELTKLLTEAENIMSEQLTKQGVDDLASETADVALDESANVTPAAATQAVTGGVNTQDDVIKVLDMACDYYKRNEPSSPVPLLLERAKGLVAKDFMEILRDLTPAGVSQAEELSGMNSQKQV